MTATRRHVDLKRGDTLIIDGTTIQLEQKSGQTARLVIKADEKKKIIHSTARMSASPTKDGEHSWPTHSLTPPESGS